MSNSTSNARKPMRMRAMTVAGGIALIGATGAGMAGTANAATSSSAQTTLAKIKYCESGGNYQAVNSSSGASGAYQFLDSTWKGLSASAGYATAASAPASVQDAAALELYNQSGTSPWAASSSCWSSMTSVPASTSSTTAASATTAASTATTASGATKATTAASTASSSSNTTASTSTAPTTKAPSTTKATPKPAPRPHGKGATKPLPTPAPGGHGGKHHTQHAAPKPPKKTGNQLPPKPGTIKAGARGTHQAGKPGDIRHLGHAKPAPKQGHRAGQAAPAQHAPVKAAA